MRRIVRPRLDVAFYMPNIGPLLEGGPTRPSGGAETQIFLLSRELARRGHAVAVIAYPTGTPLPETVDGVRVIVQTPPARGRGARRLAAFLLGLLRALRRTRARVVVQRAMGVVTGLVALTSALGGRRFVYSSAGIVDFAPERHLGGRANVRLFRIGVRLARPIVVQSEEQVDLCRAAFDRVPVLLRSIAEPVPDVPRSPESLLWVGRTAGYKRPEAFVALARALPDVPCRMVVADSRGTDADVLARLEAEVAEVPNLELLPGRPRGELLPLYDRAAAVVSTTDGEGFPNVFLEGWARGVPALALSHDSNGVIERERIGGFAHGSPERLATLARELWEQRLDCAELRARCRAYVEREHSLARVADAWERVLGLRP